MENLEKQNTRKIEKVHKNRASNILLNSKLQTSNSYCSYPISHISGITLIALVVTIVILLILTGITINLVLAEGGLFERAQQSEEEHEKGAAREKLELKLADLQLEKLVNNRNYNKNDYDYLTEELENSGFDVDEENCNLVTVDGWQFEIDRSVPKIAGQTGKVEDDGPTFTKVANPPDTDGFNKSNTYYVIWSSTTNEDGEYTIDKNTNLNGTAPSNWYDYTAGVNKWANVRTTGGENECYWVWIPRYAYCITDGYHTSTASKIDVVFLKGTTNEPIDENVGIEIKNESGSGNWNISPAFWWDENNDGIRTADEELSGIWVAKFEASSNSSNVVENPTAAQLAIDGGSDTDIDLKVRVVPNVTSWRGVTLGNMFAVCQNLTQSGNSLYGTTNIDAHMMKNTEWGAVAYLSRSAYGKGSAVWNNPYYNNTTNLSTITGLSGNTQNYKTTTHNDTNVYKYNENKGENKTGTNASTTGNVYGVYDMAGGAWEYVAGILSSKKSNSTYYDFSDTKYTKYFDWYTNYDSTKYGDAVYETSYSSSGKSSWDLDFSAFVTLSYPVFLRGGHAYYDNSNGVFGFDYSTGNDSTSFSFRPCLVSL